MAGVTGGEGFDGIAHIIQVALTPVFLLSGIGTLLNVFNTRLSRVADHLEHATELEQADGDEGQRRLMRAHLRRLRRRRVTLDTSVVLGALGGAFTCSAAFAMFVGGVRDAEIVSWLVVLFGVALFCTVVALLAFLVDGVLAWHGLQNEGPLPRTKP